MYSRVIFQIENSSVATEQSLEVVLDSLSSLAIYKVLS